VRRWWVALVACLVVAVAVPAVWFATRPPASEGVAVTSVGAPTPSPSGGAPPAGAPRSPAGTLPALTARPAAPTREAARPAPRRLRIPSVGVDASIVPVGVDASGSMVIPREVDSVGWYRFGPTPGDRAGAAVIAGHVDSKDQGPGALLPLREVGVGDPVTVTAADGATLAFRVVGKETIVKKRLPVERLFARDGSARLVLITCGGPFVPELSSYRDNLVVVAVPIGGSTP
jgi:sortase (surface protein transpeptidase)